MKGEDMSKRAKRVYEVAKKNLLDGLVDCYVDDLEEFAAQIPSMEEDDIVMAIYAKVAGIYY